MAIDRKNVVLVPVFEREIGIVAVCGEISCATDQGQMPGGAIVMAGRSALNTRLKAGEGFLEDHVDDARDRIGAVFCRGAILQYVDPIDGDEGNRAHVDEITLPVIRQRVWDHPLPIDQRQSGADRESPQRNPRAAARVRVGVRLGERPLAVGREVTQHL